VSLSSCHTATPAQNTTPESVKPTGLRLEYLRAGAFAMKAEEPHFTGPPPFSTEKVLLGKLFDKPGNKSQSSSEGQRGRCLKTSHHHVFFRTSVSDSDAGLILLPLFGIWLLESHSCVIKPNLGLIHKFSYDTMYKRLERFYCI
jgi:hypothetical protein